MWTFTIQSLLIFKFGQDADYVNNRLWGSSLSFVTEPLSLFYSILYELELNTAMKKLIFEMFINIEVFNSHLKTITSFKNWMCVCSPSAGPVFNISIRSEANSVSPGDTVQMKCIISILNASPNTGKYCLCSARENKYIVQFIWYKVF